MLTGIVRALEVRKLMSRNTLNHEFYIMLQLVVLGFAFAGIFVNMRERNYSKSKGFTYSY